jgi:carbamoyltransferase
MQPNDGEFVLGVWDGHDSGAALVQGGRVVVAINEERLSRRKLEVHFPHRAIRTCLDFAQLKTQDIRTIAYTTTDFAKTLTRTFPHLKEEYYQIRRRKKRPGMGTAWKKRLKYRLTPWKPNPLTRWWSDRVMQRALNSMGFEGYTLRCIDHHEAHAAGAYFSGFPQALVMTLDGIGDGLSGTVYRMQDGRLERLQAIPGTDSLGIFYEHVTNLMNMRELEDEGKVMALANFAYPIPDDQNPMLSLFRVDGGTIHAACSTLEMHRRLEKILWQYPAEQFCNLAQRTLEIYVLQLVTHWLATTRLNRVVLSGGVASNIKANRLIRNLPQVKDLFVFPHMGDGGQALGAACAVNNERTRISRYDANQFHLGLQYPSSEVENALKTSGLRYLKSPDIILATAERIAKGEIGLWFQGRMEYGPRALGARSILARPNSLRIKDDLNLRLKRRVWYQPFCPTMLEADARELLEDFDTASPDRFMTSAYRVKEDRRNSVIGVLNVDGTCRPQILADTSSRFGQLLLRIKDLTGCGVVLNTSLNIHGEPLACSPTDALRAFVDSGADFLAMEEYFVAKA